MRSLNAEGLGTFEWNVGNAGAKNLAMASWATGDPNNHMPQVTKLNAHIGQLKVAIEPLSGLIFNSMIPGRRESRR